MIVPCLILMLGIRMPMAAETEMDEGTVNGATGFGIGALVGGLVGGPIGALVGAAGGAFFAEQDATKDRTIGDLEVELDERDTELAGLKSDFEHTRVAMTADVQTVAALDGGAASGRPDAPLSLAVYFRTDNAGVEASLRPHLEQLGSYLKAYPELEVRLEGYSDARGDAEYNLTLSERRIEAIRRILVDAGIAPERIRGHAYGETRARASNGDADAMIFDRSVVISIGGSSSNRA
jgi:outer membrane protein OmpA-like peptidoglycan-associated protein